MSYSGFRLPKQQQKRWDDLHNRAEQEASSDKTESGLEQGAGGSEDEESSGGFNCRLSCSWSILQHCVQFYCFKFVPVSLFLHAACASGV